MRWLSTAHFPLEIHDWATITPAITDCCDFRSKSWFENLGRFGSKWPIAHLHAIALGSLAQIPDWRSERGVGGQIGDRSQLIRSHTTPEIGGGGDGVNLRSKFISPHQIPEVEESERADNQLIWRAVSTV